MIRLANHNDIEVIAQIYDEIHTQEEQKLTATGWKRDIYPTAKTAADAVDAGEMYVLEDAAGVVAAAKINKEQMPEYRQVSWEIPAEPEKVMVLHTLVVSPGAARRGYAKAFIGFYNDLAKQSGCTVLRIDTNEKNERARKMYAALGFKEAGIVPCTFNGIEGVGLVCMERRII